MVSCRGDVLGTPTPQRSWAGGTGACAPRQWEDCVHVVGGMGLAWEFPQTPRVRAPFSHALGRRNWLNLEVPGLR